MSEQSSETDLTSTRNADSAPTPQNPPSTGTVSPEKPTWRRKVLIGAAGVLVVAARVRGQVARVLVDDNYRVHRGDLLVELDKEPFQIAVAVKKAAVQTATAELGVAKAKVRGIEAEAM